MNSSAASERTSGRIVEFPKTIRLAPRWEVTAAFFCFGSVHCQGRRSCVCVCVCVCLLALYGQSAASLIVLLPLPFFCLFGGWSTKYGDHAGHCHLQGTASPASVSDGIVRRLSMFDGEFEANRKKNTWNTLEVRFFRHRTGGKVGGGFMQKNRDDRCRDIGEKEEQQQQ